MKEKTHNGESYNAKIVKTLHKNYLDSLNSHLHTLSLWKHYTIISFILMLLCFVTGIYWGLIIGGTFG